MIRELAETLSQPEYTGENRCPPCTVVNLVLAAVLGWSLSRRSRPLGAIALGGSIALVYLRGYLVPGTPELTKRYLPPAVLRWFGKDPGPSLATGVTVSTPPAADGDRPIDETTETAVDDGAESADETDEGVDLDRDGAHTVPADLETYFISAEILEPCEDGMDLCLTPAFETEWLEAIESVVEAGVDTEEAVEAFGFDETPEEFELLERDGGVYALRFGTEEIGDGPRYNAGMWPSYAALVADVAAVDPLESRLAEWDEYDPKQKGHLLNGVRMFLETCPTAEGGVELTEETVKSCCSSSTVVAAVCEETGDRLFEHELPE